MAHFTLGGEKRPPRLTEIAGVSPHPSKSPLDKGIGQRPKEAARYSKWVVAEASMIIAVAFHVKDGRATPAK
jgi:hypothetical protein